MILGIDASNISSGGGVTHLRELLRAARPTEFGFDKVVVWSPLSTLASLEDYPWLIKRTEAVLERKFLYRAVWQRRRLGVLARRENCDLLFVPGGAVATDFQPVVTMNRNLLPFEWTELLRFGFSTMTLKWILLRLFQTHSLRKAEGTIFLTNYARDRVSAVTGPMVGRTDTIPHGIDKRFYLKPRKQLSIDNFSSSHPFKIVYTSTIFAYKHQWHVAVAIAQLRAEGFPVELDLIGAGGGADLHRLESTLRHIDPSARFIRHLGVVPHNVIESYYGKSHLGVFASSCETFGQILTEYMASGLPIACSNSSAMPEILGDAGCYFDPEDPVSIARSIKELVLSPELRTQKADKAYELAQQYSWRRCADETFGFLEKIAQTSN